MGLAGTDPDRSRSSYIVVALAAGVLYGLAPVLLKIASANFYLSPYFLAAAVMLLGGFYLMQKSLHTGNLSITIPLITALSIVITFLLSTIIFGEQITIIKWFGIAALIIGGFGLVKK